jgi:hypothetical protein
MWWSGGSRDLCYLVLARVYHLLGECYLVPRVCALVPRSWGSRCVLGCPLSLWVWGVLVSVPVSILVVRSLGIRGLTSPGLTLPDLT